MRKPAQCAAERDRRHETYLQAVQWELFGAHFQGFLHILRRTMFQLFDFLREEDDDLDEEEPSSSTARRPVHVIYRINILQDILKARVRSEAVERITIVEQGVDQIDVVSQCMGQARIDDLQDHAHDVLDDRQILNGLVRVVGR